MEAYEVEQLRERLLAEQAELRQWADAAGGELADLEDIRCERVARVEALQAKEMAQETARRRRQELARIEAALSRIEAGEYGTCLTCGENIDLRRLVADPAHVRCIRCAQAADGRRP